MKTTKWQLYNGVIDIILGQFDKKIQGYNSSPSVDSAACSKAVELCKKTVEDMKLSGFVSAEQGTYSVNKADISFVNQHLEEVIDAIASIPTTDTASIPTVMVVGECIDIVSACSKMVLGTLPKDKEPDSEEQELEE